MCRLAAYVGPAIPLGQFLLDPPHNLLAQAITPREMAFARFNADGFGMGWYTGDGRPAVYTNPAPIWSDVNLPHLARSLSGPLWLATVRSATLPQNSGLVNTQPFCDDRLIFLHNGFLDDFSPLRRIIRDFLDPRIEAEIRGNTDSEHLFGLLRHLLHDDAELSIEDALWELLDLLDDWVENRLALLNIVVSDGECVYAVRHAINAACPSLYYSIDDENFPEGQLLASERLTEDEFWQPVPDHNMLILSPDAPPELIAA